MSRPIAEALAVTPSGAQPDVPLSRAEIGAYLKRYYGTPEEETRRARHALRNNLYRDGGCEYMRTVIDTVFKNLIVRELRKDWVQHARFSNALKRIADTVSTVYSEPAARTVGGSDANQQAFADVVESTMLDEVMDYANRMLNLHRALLIGPRVRVDGNPLSPDSPRTLKIDVVTPDDAFAVTSPNDQSHVIAWGVRVEYRSVRSFEEWKRPPAWQLWSDHESWLLDKDMMPVGDPVPHGLVDEKGRGVNPWIGVTYHAESVAGFWPGEEGEDLVAAQVAIWISNVLLLKETKSATKQTTISGDTSMMPRGQPLDTETPTQVPEGVTAQTVDMSMDTSTFTDAADHVLEGVGNNYGLSLAALKHQGVQSAEARDLMLEPLRQLRRKQIKTFRRVERRLASLMSIVLGKDAPANDNFKVVQFGCNFGEPQVLLDEATRLALFEKKQALGITNILDYLMSEDPDKDQKQALAALVRNFMISTMRVGMMKDMMAMSGALGADAARADSGETANGGRPAPTEKPPEDAPDLSWVEGVLDAA